MRITSEIVKGLYSIDLSSKVKVAERYEELSSSPVLFPLIRHGGNTKPFAPKGSRPIESLLEIARTELRHYASTKRDRINEATLHMIKNRIAVLFSEWEEEWEVKTHKEGEGMGYIWNYARERGLSDSKQPLAKKEIAALDDTAHKILSIFERYFLYSFTPTKGFLLSDTDVEKARAEMEREYGIAFSEEWSYELHGGLTTSFEEEVQFFGVEYSLYCRNIIAAIANGALIPSDERLSPSYEVTIDLQRARESRYKDYITD